MPKQRPQRRPTIEAQNGLCNDIQWEVPEDKREEYNRIMQEEFSRNKWTTDKIRVTTSEIKVSETGTKITLIQNGASVIIELPGIVLQQVAIKEGGGGRNLLSTVDALVNIQGSVREQIHTLGGFDEILKPEAQVITEDPETLQQRFENTNMKASKGKARTSHVLPHPTKSGSKIYFTDIASRRDEVSDDNMGYLKENGPRAIALQQVPEKDLIAFLTENSRRNLAGEELHTLFTLLSADFINLGISSTDRRKKSQIEALLASSNILSFNLEEAAKFTGDIAMLKSTSPEVRAQCARHYAQTLHKKGVDKVVITDAEHGVYVSLKYPGEKEEFLWKQFPIDNTIGDFVKQLIQKGKHTDILLKRGDEGTGCGDSFAGTVYTLAEVFGITDWDFIMHFAGKIAGLVFRSKEPNIKNIAPEIITELFLKSFHTYKESPQNTNNIQHKWSILRMSDDFSNPFQAAGKRVDINKAQSGLSSSTIVVTGEKGAGKRTIREALLNKLQLPEDLRESDPIWQLIKEYNIKFNVLTPYYTDVKDVEALKKECGDYDPERDISSEDFNEKVKSGELICTVPFNDGTRKAFSNGEFTSLELYNSAETSHTVDIVFSGTQARSAVDETIELNQYPETTGAHIMHLVADSEAIEKRINARSEASSMENTTKYPTSRYAEMSGGRDFDTSRYENKNDENTINKMLCDFVTVIAETIGAKKTT